MLSGSCTGAGLAAGRTGGAGCSEAWATTTGAGVAAGATSVWAPSGDGPAGTGGTHAVASSTPTPRSTRRTPPSVGHARRGRHLVVVYCRGLRGGRDKRQPSVAEDADHDDP